jgi:hypothetical protein
MHGYGDRQLEHAEKVTYHRSVTPAHHIKRLLPGRQLIRKYNGMSWTVPGDDAGRKLTEARGNYALYCGIDFID